KTRFHAEFLGFNSRLDALQAAVLEVKLGYLEGWNARRRVLASRYDSALSDLPIQLPRSAVGCEHAYNQYTVATVRRDALSKFLAARRIETMVYYPIPLHRQGLYAQEPQPCLPNAERLANEVLSLPLYPELSDEQQEVVIDGVKGFFRDC